MNKELTPEEIEKRKRKRFRKFLRRNTYHSWESSAMRVFGPKPTAEDDDSQKQWKRKYGKMGRKKERINNSWNLLDDSTKPSPSRVISTPMGGQNKRR